jgi:antitoxin ParD1/3/4
MQININLTPQLDEMVREKVASGLYNSASEVVREALRLMEAEDQLKKVKLAELKTAIKEGLESGRGGTLEEAIAENRAARARKRK